MLEMLFYIFLFLFHVVVPCQITITGNNNLSSCCTELEKKVRELEYKVQSNALKAKVEALEGRIEMLEHGQSGLCGKKNLALNKKCGQSSYGKGHPSCGIGNNGNLNTYMHTIFYWKNGFWHGESNPYWWVDLENSCLIKQIRIYNRKDCCGFRLRDVEVTVGHSLSNMKLCGFYKGPAADGEIVNISCKLPRVARYVKVMIKEENTKDTFIHVNEIEVYSQ
ncbi:fucolectin-like [Mytilus trossulus]|uniref:fucolectin-like n=1 Tax=Mytilus trossulus TaxID=6551 RepID=UPI0030063AF3